jgi:hypothetical protein
MVLLESGLSLRGGPSVAAPAARGVNKRSAGRRLMMARLKEISRRVRSWLLSFE